MQCKARHSVLDICAVGKAWIPSCRFDEECREQVADGLKGRGIHLYPDTTPTRYNLLQSL